MTDIDVDALERQVTDFIHDEATVREWNYLRRAQLMDNLSTALRQQQSSNAHLLQGLKGAKFIYEQEQKEVARLRAVIEEVRKSLPAEPGLNAEWSQAIAILNEALDRFT